ncbi:hypothetical protein [Lacisediminihabitans changchengi]|uniref:Uncharacterized protein n=1 Tax=Lacisediminihabitans changchengi TaxID=2787634 RepID=A0A934SKL0_9MICO|nr:hypothetical protein [Lacisediminihabitans changchengi]MBK4348412.1 hypothetical protein [Lacisediminihabitans changchengi]
MSDNPPVHPDDERREDAVTPEFSSAPAEPTAPVESHEGERIEVLDGELIDSEPIDSPEPSRGTHETIEYAEVVEDEAPALVEPPQPERVTLAEAPPVVEVPAEERPADIDNVEVIPAPAPVVAPAVIPQPSQTVYVEAPNPPKKRGNRGIGSLVALLSAVIFGLIFALVVALIIAARTGDFSFDFVSRPTFWVPVLFFAIGFVLLVLIINRAGWWVHVIGSLFVALFVYFGTVATLLVINGIFGETPSEAGRLVAAALVDPFVIAAALVARETALWMGLAIAARGRRMKARNAEARTEYEMQMADRRAEYERRAESARAGV